MNIRDIMATAIPAVEYMYDRSATVQRYEDYEKPNGADGQRWELKYSDIPCRLSTVGMQTLNNTSQDGANVIQYDAKLILSSDFEIKAGDIITVDGEQFESAKEPFKYVSHQEALLLRKGYA